MDKEKIKEYLDDIEYMLTIPEVVDDMWEDASKAIVKDVSIIRKELEKN